MVCSLQSRAGHCFILKLLHARDHLRASRRTQLLLLLLELNLLSRELACSRLAAGLAQLRAQIQLLHLCCLPEVGRARDGLLDVVPGPLAVLILLLDPDVPRPEAAVNAALEDAAVAQALLPPATVDRPEIPAPAKAGISYMLLRYPYCDLHM